MTTQSVLREVGGERFAQDTKWGEQNHKPQYWLCVLMEELGEAAKASIADTVSPANYRRELLQVAAVAVAAIESWDRFISRQVHEKTVAHIAAMDEAHEATKESKTRFGPPEVKTLQLTPEEMAAQERHLRKLEGKHDFPGPSADNGRGVHRVAPHVPALEEYLARGPSMNDEGDA